MAGYSRPRPSLTSAFIREVVVPVVAVLVAITLGLAAGGARQADAQDGLCGAPANPWGYTFCSGTVITSPPSSICQYIACIANFWNGRGYVIQCRDGTFGKSGGIQGSCSGHGGNNRPLYAPSAPPLAPATPAPTGPPCPTVPLWVNDLTYGSAGGGFYFDPPSGLVWTAERRWHVPVPREPLWVNALTYGSAGGGFYYDTVSGLVWAAERGWHSYGPRGCSLR